MSGEGWLSGSCISGSGHFLAVSSHGGKHKGPPLGLFPNGADSDYEGYALMI